MTYLPAQSREQYFITHVKPSGPSDDPVCPICFDDWNPDTSAIVQTICRHTFHHYCLARWLYGIGSEACPNTCPGCRAVCFPNHSEQEVYHVDFDLNPELWADSNYASNDTFDAIATHIDGIVRPLLSLDTIWARFGIDLECSEDPSRFLQAMRHTVSTVVAESRISPSSHESRMSMLALNLNDRLTIEFLAMSLFIKTQWALMTPTQWVHILRVRNRVGRDASRSTDFGTSTATAWLDHINDRYKVRYEIEIPRYFANATVAHWKETNTAGQVVNEGSHDCTITDGNSTTYINVQGTGLSPGLVLYFQNESLWIYERVIGNIVGFNIDEHARVVIVRGSAGHTFKVHFLQDERGEIATTTEREGMPSSWDW
ncbi:unnamed protein product [Alternaria alternata]|jgi:hypothetical protein